MNKEISLTRISELNYNANQKDSYQYKLSKYLLRLKPLYDKHLIII